MRPMSPVLPSQPITRESEIVFAKDQAEYRQLPAIRTSEGTVISRWRLTWRERLNVLLYGNVFLQQLTFNAPLQPQLPTVEEPRVFVDEDNA